MSVIIARSDAVTAYGWGMDALWSGLLSGDTAIQSTDRFAERGFSSDQAGLIANLEINPSESRVMAMLRRLLSPLVGRLDPTTPLILATTVGEIDYVERSILEGHEELAAQSRPQATLARIKNLLQLRGPAMMISSACASSSMAITQAASLIRRGDAKTALVVACDSVSEFVYSGFSMLHSLSAEPARPFDAERNGLSLGEAAAWVLLRAGDASGDGDGSTSVLGWGNTTDATHMTAPDRDAGGLSRAIGKACSMAKCNAEDICFIAAHGTATVYSDAMEMLAFSNSVHQPKPVFSIKGGVGHTLATAGLLQILVCERALSLGIVPATVGLRSPDQAAIGWAHVSPARIDRSALALSTNSGFGGVNTAVLLGNGVSR